MTAAAAQPEVVAGEGDWLGRYQLLYRVGMGGMAAVFLAREHGAGGLERWVAIKRIHPQLGKQRRFTEMLLDEARLAARIAHPNVAQMLDLGEADGVPYIVMEYLHGQTLSAVIRRATQLDGAPDIDMMARVLADAAEGAHAAHELRGADGAPLGLVHRDISPQNIFVTYEGAVKVVDFGIAKARGRATLTEPGTLKGKFSYMPPEQARGGTVDRRSDVYALGLVLYEATTGRRAVDRSDQDALSGDDDTVVAPILRFPRGYPSELAAMVKRASAPAPDERFPTARELARALEKLVVGRRALTDPAQIASWMERLFPEQSHTPIGSPEGRPRPEGVARPAPTSTRAATGAKRGRSRVLVGALAALLGFLAVINWVAWNREASSGVPTPPTPPASAPTPPTPPASAPAPSSRPIGDPVEHTAPAPPAPQAPVAVDVASTEPTEAPAPARTTDTQGPRSRERAGTGTLDVRSVPWSKVTVDGGAPRFTPLVGRPLPAGWHRVHLVTEDGRTKDMRVHVTAGETTSVMARF